MATLAIPIDDGLAGAVALAGAGDETAFARIIRAHHDDKTRVCFVICGDLDVADEAVQAAWPIAWRKLGSLRDPDRLRPWLVSIAANEARQLIRQRRRRTVVELAMVGSLRSGVDPAGHVEDLDLINALARLDPDDRARGSPRSRRGLHRRWDASLTSHVSRGLTGSGSWRMVRRSSASPRPTPGSSVGARRSGG